MPNKKHDEADTLSVICTDSESESGGSDNEEIQKNKVGKVAIDKNPETDEPPQNAMPTRRSERTATKGGPNTDQPKNEVKQHEGNQREVEQREDGRSRDSDASEHRKGPLTLRCLKDVIITHVGIDNSHDNPIVSIERMSKKSLQNGQQ